LSTQELSAAHIRNDSAAPRPHYAAGSDQANVNQHYDQINTMKSVDQLSDEQSRELIAAAQQVDERYQFREVSNSDLPKKVGRPNVLTLVDACWR